MERKGAGSSLQEARGCTAQDSAESTPAESTQDCGHVKVRPAGGGKGFPQPPGVGRVLDLSSVGICEVRTTEGGKDRGVDVPWIDFCEEP